MTIENVDVRPFTPVMYQGREGRIKSIIGGYGIVVEFTDRLGHNGETSALPRTALDLLRVENLSEWYWENFPADHAAKYDGQWWPLHELRRRGIEPERPT